MIDAHGHYEVKLGKLPTLTSTPTHYCAGCEHGTLTRLIGNALQELGARERTVLVDSVGCSVLAHVYLNTDAVSAPHGRAPAVMTGIKRVRPDLLVTNPSVSDNERVSSNPYLSWSRSRARTQYSMAPRLIWAMSLEVPPATMHHIVPRPDKCVAALFEALQTFLAEDPT